MPPPIAPQLIVWLPWAVICHSYFVYPLSLRCFPRRYRQDDYPTEQGRFSVAILIPAFNEEAVIQEKIENALAVQYAGDRLQVLVGSDCSTDGTASLVRAFADRRVRLVEMDHRAGKAAVINRLSRETDADILVMTDANAFMAADSLQFLLRPFSNPNVGAVSGAKIVRVPLDKGQLAAEATYSNFENRIKTLESGMGGMSGCRGALMAVRRRDFAGFPLGTVNEDLVLGFLAVLSGRRVVFEPRAQVFEASAESVSAEFHRRVRIGAGDFQALFRHGRILFHSFPFIFYTLLSHKILRWLLPFFMLAALPASLVLLSWPLYRIVLGLQVLFILLAGAGWVLDSKRIRIPGMTSIYHFAAMNAALLAGFFMFVRGMTAPVWDRTARSRTSVEQA